MSLEAEEIRRMSPEDRARLLSELKMELIKLRTQARTGTLTNTARIRTVKKNIARILTVMNEERRKSAGGGGGE